MPEPVTGAALTAAAAKGAHLAWPYVRDALKEYIADNAVNNALITGGALEKDDGEAVIGAMTEATSGTKFQNPELDRLYQELSIPCQPEKWEFSPSLLTAWVTDNSDTKSAYAFVPLRTAMATKMHAQNDPHNLRKQVFQSFEDYYQVKGYPKNKDGIKSGMDKATAAMISLDNQIQTYLILLDNAAKMPGKAGEEAIRDIEIQFIAFCERYNETGATVGSFWKQHTVGTKRQDVIRDVREKMEPVFQEARENQKTQLAKLLPSCAEQTARTSSAIIDVLYNSNERSPQIKVNRTVESKETMPLSRRCSAIPSLTSKSTPREKSAAAFAAASAVASDIRNTATETGTKQLNDKKNEVRLAEVLHRSLTSYGAKKLDQAIGKPSGANTAGLNAPELGIQRSIPKTLKAELNKANAHLADARTFMRLMLDEVAPGESSALTPDPEYLAPIAMLCANDPELEKHMLESLRKNPQAAAVATCLENQINKINQLRQTKPKKGMFKTPDAKKDQTAFDAAKRLEKLNIVTINPRFPNELHLDKLQTKADFNDLLSVLEYQEKNHKDRHDTDLIHAVEQARDALFPQPQAPVASATASHATTVPVVASDHQPPASSRPSPPQLAATDDDETVQRSLGGTFAGQSTGLTRRSSETLEPTPRTPLAKEVRDELATLDIHRRVWGRFISSNDSKKREFFYTCGKKEQLPSILKGIISYSVNDSNAESDGKIDIKAIKTEEQYQALIDYLQEIDNTDLKKSSPGKKNEDLIKFLKDYAPLTETQKRVLALLQKIDPSTPHVATNFEFNETIKSNKLYNNVLRAVTTSEKHQTSQLDQETYQRVQERVNGIEPAEREIFNDRPFSTNHIKENNAILQLIEKGIVSINREHTVLAIYVINWEKIETPRDIGQLNSMLSYFSEIDIAQRKKDDQHAKRPHQPVTLEEQARSDVLSKLTFDHLSTSQRTLVENLNRIQKVLDDITSKSEKIAITDPKLTSHLDVLKAFINNFDDYRQEINASDTLKKSYLTNHAHNYAKAQTILKSYSAFEKAQTIKFQLAQLKSKLEEKNPNLTDITNTLAELKKTELPESIGQWQPEWETEYLSIKSDIDESKSNINDLLEQKSTQFIMDTTNAGLYACTSATNQENNYDIRSSALIDAKKHIDKLENFLAGIDEASAIGQKIKSGLTQLKAQFKTAQTAHCTITLNELTQATNMLMSAPLNHNAKDKYDDALANAESAYHVHGTEAEKSTWEATKSARNDNVNTAIAQAKLEKRKNSIVEAFTKALQNRNGGDANKNSALNTMLTAIKNAQSEDDLNKACDTFLNKASERRRIKLFTPDGITATMKAILEETAKDTPNAAQQVGRWLAKNKNETNANEKFHISDSHLTEWLKGKGIEPGVFTTPASSAKADPTPAQATGPSGATTPPPAAVAK